MEQENNYTTNTENDESFSLSEFIRDYIKHWKWFLLSVIVCMAIAGGYLMITQKQYSTSLSILIDVERRTASSTPSMSLDGIFNLSTDNLANEIVILQSPDLMRTVVDTLHLQNTYYAVQRMRKTELYNNTPILARLFSNDSDVISSANFYVKKNKNNFSVKGSYWYKGEIEFEKNINDISEKIPLSEGTHIQLQLTGKPMTEGAKYYVNIRNALSAAYSLCANLSVEQSLDRASVLKLSLSGNNSGKSAAILRELVKQYNLMNVNMKNEIAYNTAIFINERLKQISNELGEAESNIVSYKQQNSIADLGTEAQLFVQQSAQNEQKLLDIETQLNVISYIQTFINDPSNQRAAIPNPNNGITDIGLSQMINNYNTSLLANDIKLRGITSENPDYKQIMQQSENTRNSIISSLNAMKQTYNVTKNDLMRQLAQSRARISSVPQQEMGLLGKDREQQIKQNLFLFLMQKREETNLTIASTPNKARIVISPVENTGPVAPRNNIILFGALILAILIPFAVIYIMNLLKTQISSRHDLEKISQVSVIGQITKNVTQNMIAVEKNHSTSIGETFRSLRNNINFIFKNKENKIIVVTSTTKHEGKTFVSANLAVSYAFSGKKTLLVGADVRNPKLKKYFTFTNAEGLCNYLAKEDNWHNYLNKLDIDGNLHVIHSGTIPPNPNELLMSPMFGKLVEEAKKEYDFIIFDSAPVGLVSDGYLVAAFTDLTLYVMREGVTPKDSVNFVNQQKNEKKLNNMYIVLNASTLDGTYKYGYGKEYGYNN
ncbi:MAG: polysaccharide biosynthesis tyrosine autokinase [Paludibacter sp.]|nr:polysaccharide biosynthesis tyrosine autokinase [Paludibacter sp.]